MYFFSWSNAIFKNIVKLRFKPSEVLTNFNFMIRHTLLISDKQKKLSFYKMMIFTITMQASGMEKVVYLLWCYMCNVSVIYIAAVTSVQCFCISIKTMTIVMDATY